MTRRSPSRTSTVFRSFADISFTIRSSSPTSIGLSDDLPPERPVELVPVGFLFDRLAKLIFLQIGNLLDVAAFERLVEGREHIAAAVGVQLVVLDAEDSYAMYVVARID